MERIPVKKKNYKRYISLYVMMSVSICYYVVYRYAPIFGNIIALKDYNTQAGIFRSNWAEPLNKYFKMFFESPNFRQLLTNTAIISFYKLVFVTFGGISLALLLNEARKKRLRQTVQTASFLPYFLSWVVIYSISQVFFSQSTGLINHAIRQSTGETIPFLSSDKWFRFILIMTDVWKEAGWSSIIYIAAMAGIDPALYEAARVDGAGRLRMIISITLPCIKNVIIMMLILKLGTIMDAGFEQVFIMYSVPVYPVADILDTWVYRVGLQQMNFSLAAAAGLFKSVISFILVVAANKVSKRWGESMW